MTAALPALAAVAVLGALVALRPRVLVVRVVGDSMAPTLVNDQRLFAWRRPCRVGDVVVFRGGYAAHDVGYLVKRVAAVGGDPVPADLAATVDTPTVPPGHILVRGDAPRSLDSRRLGLIEVGAVRGVVLGVPRTARAGGARDHDGTDG